MTDSIHGTCGYSVFQKRARKKYLDLILGEPVMPSQRDRLQSTRTCQFYSRQNYTQMDWKLCTDVTCSRYLESNLYCLG